MKRTLAKSSVAVLTLLVLMSALTMRVPVHAAPSLRVQVDQHGDFVTIGNTFGQECAAGTPAPVVGTLGACGTNTADSAPDVFWRADSPADGQAEANTGITVAQARSSAMLSLPVGAQVTHAYLYWAALTGTANADTTATLDRPGAGGFSQSVTALDSLTFTGNRYRSVADVTALVQTNGAGAYRVSDVDIIDLVNRNDSNAFDGWWMVVLYKLDTDPLRNLTIYDGLDPVSSSLSQNISLSGFLVPPGPIDAKLGVVSMEGDNTGSGDALAFNGSTLSNAQNPANNFFNGTHSYLGTAVSTAGDLPQLAGTPQSMSGIDLDVVDISPYLTTGQTSASVTASSSGDVYFLTSFVTSITTFKPDVSASTKTVVDLNGGAVLPGDTLEYTIAITNTGNDTSILTSLNDPLPTGVTYVPASIEIVSGANAGVQTDASGDDQSEYDTASHSIVARLGTGADAAQGGSLGVNASTALRFRVTVDATCAGPIDIANQATINITGELSGVQSTFVTDGNGAAPGNPPTIVSVNFRCLSVGKDGTGGGTVTSAPAGIDCGVTCGGVFPDGTLITLTATADPGSTFTGWSGALSGTTNPSSLTINADQTVTATFIQNMYTITPTADVNGSISPNAPQTVIEGDSSTFTIAADAGYHIADVVVDGASVGPVTTYTFSNVTANHTIAATFNIDAPTPTATETPTATATDTSTPTATDTSTPTATNTSAPTATETPTATASDTSTPTVTNTSTSIATETPTATASDTSTPTVTNTSAPTAIETPTATATDTSTPTATETPTAIATDTSTPIASSTATSTAIASSTATSTPIATATPTVTSTATSTAIASSTATSTPIATATPTAIATDTSTAIASSTATSTPIATATPTVTNTATSTAIASSTATSTPIATATPTVTNTATSTAIASSTATSTPIATATPTVTNTATSTSIIASSTATSTPTSTRTPLLYRFYLMSVIKETVTTTSCAAMRISECVAAGWKP